MPLLKLICVNSKYNLLFSTFSFLMNHSTLLLITSQSFDIQSKKAFNKIYKCYKFRLWAITFNFKKFVFKFFYTLIFTKRFYPREFLWTKICFKDHHHASKFQEFFRTARNFDIFPFQWNIEHSNLFMCRSRQQSYIQHKMTSVV